MTSLCASWHVPHWPSSEWLFPGVGSLFTWKKACDPSAGRSSTFLPPKHFLMRTSAVHGCRTGLGGTTNSSRRSGPALPKLTVRNASYLHLVSVSLSALKASMGQVARLPLVLGGRMTPGSMTVKALEMSPSANLPGPLCHLHGRVRHLCTWGASWRLKVEPLLPLDVSPSDTFIRLRRSVLFKE